MRRQADVTGRPAGPREGWGAHGTLGRVWASFSATALLTFKPAPLTTILRLPGQ